MADITTYRPDGIKIKAVDMGDDTHAERIAAVLIDPANGQPYAAGGGNDRELVVTTYRAKNAFAGASLGDTITSTQIIDVSGTPATVAVIWRNQSAATDLAGAPAAAALEVVGATALTDAQLRAAAVAISAASLPLPTGAASTDDIQAVRDRLPSAFLTPGLMAVDTLGTPGVARVQATSAVAASIVLTSTCRRVSMYATTGTWYSLSGTATATSHYLEAGGRIDFDVPANTTISVLQEITAGSVRISELV